LVRIHAFALVINQILQVVGIAALLRRDSRITALEMNIRPRDWRAGMFALMNAYPSWSAFTSAVMIPQQSSALIVSNRFQT
jgi:hypothetical protein